MVLSLNIIAIINLLLLSFLFFLKRGNNKSNILLSIILIAPVFSHIFNVLVYQDLISIYRYIIILAIPVGFLWSPSIYFYALFNIQARKNFRIKDIFHLIPFFLALIFVLWLLFVSTQMQQSFFNCLATSTPFLLQIMNFVVIVQIFIYLTVSWLVVTKYNKRLKKLFSDADRLSANWVQELIIVFVVIYLIVYVPFLCGLGNTVFFILFPISTSFCYLFVLYKTITSPMIFSSQELALLQNVKEAVVLCTEENSLKDQCVSSNSFIIENCASILDDYMRKFKPYLNAELNIKILSEQLDVSVHCLSETINKKFHKNFFDFINQYRVEEAKYLLLSADLEKYTIDSISNLCGFGSRSSFYTAFKKHTGTSPGEYQKDIFK